MDTVERDDDYWASLSSPGRKALQMHSDVKRDRDLNGPHRDGGVLRDLDLAFRANIIPSATHQVRESGGICEVHARHMAGFVAGGLDGE
jgi:hypothetical protein